MDQNLLGDLAIHFAQSPPERSATPRSRSSQRHGLPVTGDGNRVAMHGIHSTCAVVGYHSASLKLCVALVQFVSALF